MCGLGANLDRDPEHEWIKPVGVSAPSPPPSLSLRVRLRVTTFLLTLSALTVYAFAALDGLGRLANLLNNKQVTSEAL